MDGSEADGACFDTNLPTLLCKCQPVFFKDNFGPKQSKGGLYQNKVTVSLTFTRRLGY